MCPVLGSERIGGVHSGNIGSGRVQSGELNPAETLLQQALQIQQEMGDLHGTAYNLGTLALLYHRRKSTRVPLRSMNKPLIVRKPLATGALRVSLLATLERCW